MHNFCSVYPEILHYTNGKRILKYGLNRKVSLETIMILIEDNIDIHDINVSYFGKAINLCDRFKK